MEALSHGKYVDAMFYTRMKAMARVTKAMIISTSVTVWRLLSPSICLIVCAPAATHWPRIHLSLVPSCLPPLRPRSLPLSLHATAARERVPLGTWCETCVRHPLGCSPCGFPVFLDAQIASDVKSNSLAL